MATIVEILIGIIFLIPCVHGFRHFNDIPDFNWETMECIHPGNKKRQTEIPQIRI